MTTPSLNASVFATPPLTIDQLYRPANTPGNVGLCLSGGGTRACCAGMGQLRALAMLQANGNSLLGQIKAMSTVSGGSWLGVPYQYMPAAGPKDAAYLGAYDADQGTLTVQDLQTLPEGNAGIPMTSFLFSLEGIAGTALLLYETFLKLTPSQPLPANMLWQMVMSLNILDSYGLLQMNLDGGQPKDTFSATAASLKAITDANGSLAMETAYLFADQVDTSRTQRPLHLCNMSMLVKAKDIPFDMLVPVQANGLMTGIVGAPANATDANSQKVGGGGVQSFAYNSSFVSQSGDTAEVTQTRQWSLTDIMGTSSAAFAEKVKNQLKQWEQFPHEFKLWLKEKEAEIIDWIKHHLPFELHDTTLTLVARHSLDAPAFATAISFPDIQTLVPAYPSWSVAAPAPNANANNFADGGSLENTGLASLLAFTDIDSAIVCVNSDTPLAIGKHGISDGKGGWIAGTNIIVDEAIPPLFGYQPYHPSHGYRPYSAGNASQEDQIYAYNQVFASSEFTALLTGLWEAAKKDGAPSTQPAILSQPLIVQANAWFGVPAGSTPMTIVWVYLNYASDWTALFANNQPVKQIVADEVAKHKFPHYNTLATHLTATQINLLAHLSSWSMVSADQDSQVFSNLFKA
ncbi:MAG TPA: hypothetical protein VIM98_17175 [Dyella sp.]|uniref:hypothetical protein n=1 Tax=Dyella sp. TaxID=1869338 RepID=UPI002F92ED15